MARWFGTQGKKTKTFVSNVYIHHLVTVAGFPLSYIYVNQYQKY